MIAFGNLMGEVVGLDAFARYLGDTGRNARVAKPEEVPWLESSFFDQHKQLVVLEKSPVQVISIRMQGAIGPRQNLINHSFSFKVGPIPIMSNRVWPLQYNYIVRGPERFALASKLKQKTKGFFARERQGIYWSGGELASTLMRDEALMADLFQYLDVEDALEVIPETGKGYTRIVHKTTMSVRYNLLADEIVQLYRGKLPEPLLNAMETIARCCT